MALGVRPALSQTSVAPQKPEVVMPVEFLISPRKFCQVLAIAVVCLTVVGIAVQIFKYRLGHDYLLGLVPLFDLDSDVSVPSWYSAVTLLLCSLLLAIISNAQRRVKDRFALHWGVLSLIFLYLSVDEAARVHETIGNTLRLKFIRSTQGILYYNTWVIYGAALVLVVAVSYIKFLAHLPAKTRRLFVLAGLIFVAGTLGMDIVDGRYWELYPNQNLTYQIMAVAEEFLEMTAIVIFIYALMSYMVSHVRPVIFRIEGKGSGSKS